MSQRIKVIIVLGDKPNEDGSMTNDHRQRCDLALQRCDPNYLNIVILSGGITRQGCQSEACLAHGYITDVIMGSFTDDTIVDLLLEPLARTTPENIVFSEEVLQRKGVHPDELEIIGRAGQIPKVSVITPRVWITGTPTTSYVAGLDNTSRLTKFLDATVMVFLSWYDPKGNSWLYTLLKKLSRNG